MDSTHGVQEELTGDTTVSYNKKQFM